PAPGRADGGEGLRQPGQLRGRVPRAPGAGPPAPPGGRGGGGHRPGGGGPAGGGHQRLRRRPRCGDCGGRGRCPAVRGGGGPGGGPASALGPHLHPQAYGFLVGQAPREAVPYQVEPVPGRTGTDAWALQVARSGVATGLLSVPLRYMHSTVETVDVKDIEATGRLLAAALAAMEPEWVRGLSR